MYGLQHGALAHTEQQAIKGPTITSVKPFKREIQRSNLYTKCFRIIRYFDWITTLSSHSKINLHIQII